MASNIISSSPSYSVFVPFYLFYSVFLFPIISSFRVSIILTTPTTPYPPTPWIHLHDPWSYFLFLSNGKNTGKSWCYISRMEPFVLWLFYGPNNFSQNFPVVYLRFSSFSIYFLYKLFLSFLRSQSYFKLLVHYFLDRFAM